MDTKDKELIAAIINNDENSLNEFLKKYDKLILNYVLNYNLEKDDIEDFIYNIIINDKLEIDNLSAYLKKALKNFSYKKSLEVKTLELDDNYISYVENYDANINFHKLISRFDEFTRKILILRFKYDYTYEQIGNLFGISKVAILKRIKKSCEILKREILLTEDF